MAPRGVGTQGCKKLRFFKIVFGEDNSKAMYLPPMIAQKVQHLAGRETDIEDASGARWPVTVSQINGSLAFQSGWQKFYSDHRLRKGEVLVFKYIWGRHFTVRVFGLSACDRLNFNNEMPRKSKRARRDPGPVVEEEQFQTININSGDKPPVSEVGRSPVPMEVEVLECMMKKEDGCYQREDRTIWGDLSIFEQNILLPPSPNESQNVSKSHIGISDQAKTIGDDVQMDEVEGHSDDSLTDKPSYTELAPSHPDTVDKTNKSGHDAEIDVIQTNKIKGHSGDVVSNTFKKAVETKTVPFHHDITKQAIEKGYDTQTAAINSSQTDIKQLKKPFECGNSRKGMLDISNVQNGIFQILSSPVAKEPSVKSAFKSEMMEMEDEARPFPPASCGKEPTVVDNHGQMKVKEELQSYDDNPPPVAFTFSAEVKNNVYLELPVELKSRQKGKRKSCKVVYLKDSNERIWPLLCPEKSGMKALCLNWTNFCQENNIKPGDECRFRSENETPYIVRVDVIPKSD
ncbi:hypothetical protein ACS0TY_031182 [Phlomoides rotata]